MLETYPNTLRLSGSRYLTGRHQSLDAMLEGAPAWIGWLGGLGVAAGSFILAAAAAASPTLFLTAAGGSTGLFLSTSPLQDPSWLKGPLAGLVAAPSGTTVTALLDFGLPAMFLLYCLAVIGSGRLRTRHVFGLAVVAQLITVLGPAGYPSDQFVYLEFSRMWAALGLNPYDHVIGAAPHVGVFYGWSGLSWPGALSPYGPLFTLLIAPFSTLPFAAAYWTSRLLILVAMLITVWLCGVCAAEIGASRQRTIAFVGLNPLILFYCVGGAHNDILAVLPLLLAMLLFLRARRTPASAIRDRVASFFGPDRLVFAAGLLLAAGAGIKASVLVSVPALLIATNRRRAAALGLLVGGAGVWLVTVLCFGGYLPALGTQSQFIAPTSFGSILGNAAGLGGETNALRAGFELLLVVAVGVTVWLAWRRPQDAATYAAWAAVALVATISWEEPWYAVLFLVPASCSRSRTLKAVCVGLSLLLVLIFLPGHQYLNGSSNPLTILHWNSLVASQS